MKSKFHREITTSVLGCHFSDAALNAIIKANIKQDRIKYQFGHDYIHFDGSAFSEGFEYSHSQETELYNAIDIKDYKNAWVCLGRILHSWQDFYSHSNYVRLWLEKTLDGKPEMIDHDDQAIFRSPKLKSGKNYGLIEFIALLPGLSKVLTPLMPSDSHAKMNLDSPKSGSYFEFAYAAAEKRTAQVLDQIFNFMKDKKFEQDRINAFLGK
jgi:hypothetical protein